MIGVSLPNGAWGSTVPEVFGKIILWFLWSRRPDAQMYSFIQPTLTSAPTRIPKQLVWLRSQSAAEEGRTPLWELPRRPRHPPLYHCPILGAEQGKPEFSETRLQPRMLLGKNGMNFGNSSCVPNHHKIRIWSPEYDAYYRLL